MVRELSKENPTLTSKFGESISSTPGAGESLEFLAYLSNGAIQACKILEQENPSDEVALAICDFLIDELDRRLTMAIKHLERLTHKKNCGSLTRLKISKRFHTLSTRRLGVGLDDLNFLLTFVCPTMNTSHDDITIKICITYKILIEIAQELP